MSQCLHYDIYAVFCTEIICLIMHVMFVVVFLTVVVGLYIHKAQYSAVLIFGSWPSKYGLEVFVSFVCRDNHVVVCFRVRVSIRARVSITVMVSVRVCLSAS